MRQCQRAETACRSCLFSSGVIASASLKSPHNPKVGIRHRDQSQLRIQSQAGAPTWLVGDGTRSPRSAPPRPVELCVAAATHRRSSRPSPRCWWTGWRRRRQHHVGVTWNATVAGRETYRRHTGRTANAKVTPKPPYGRCGISDLQARTGLRIRCACRLQSAT